MLAAIKHGLGNLVNFHGRDARQAFWYYVLFVYVVIIVITMAWVVPMTIQAIAAGVRAGMAAAQGDESDQNKADQPAARAKGTR